MEATTQKIDLKNLDKSGWKSFRFDEIASKISETVDPNSTTLETYVGLEHLDPEDIHIRRKGTPNDVSGGKLKCYPGDVMFGKRRAYQRKAAIVDFDGICSAHAFVFRANPEIIDPKLFPFFLHSDQFMHRMVDISVGGLSPTINWGDLKHQEFLLPPKEKQARLAELLWAMDEVIEREKAVLTRFIIGYKALKKFIKDTYNLSTIKLGDKINILSGYPFASRFFNVDGKGIPLIRIRDIKNSTIETFFSGEYNPDYIISKGDLIVGMDGDFIMNIWNGQDALLNQRIIKITAAEKDNIRILEFLNHFLQDELNKINRGTGATTVKHLSVSDVKKIKLPNPDREMNNVIDQLNLFKVDTVKDQIYQSNNLQKSLINQIF